MRLSACSHGNAERGRGAGCKSWLLKNVIITLATEPPTPAPTHWYPTLHAGPAVAPISTCPASTRSYERSCLARPSSAARPSRAARRSPPYAPARVRIATTRDQGTIPRTPRATSARRSLPRAHMHKLTTRKQRARDTLHARCGSLGSRWPVSKAPMHSLIRLRREGRE